MKIAIITPVYRAWNRVKQCMDAIDANTKNEYVHVLVNDASPDTPEWFDPKYDTEKRKFITVPDDVPPERHTARITKMLQKGYDTLQRKYARLFVVESDVMVPPEWDQKMLDIVKAIERPDEHPIGWNSLEAYAVDEAGNPTYPMPQNPPLGEYHIPDTQVHLQITRFNDWNCILFNPKVLGLPWRFDAVPSHHDILLSKKIQSLTGWPNFRTTDVKVVHYAGSSRELLP